MPATPSIFQKLEVGRVPVEHERPGQLFREFETSAAISVQNRAFDSVLLEDLREVGALSATPCDHDPPKL